MKTKNFNVELKSFLNIDEIEIEKSLQNDFGIKRLKMVHPICEGISDVEYWKKQFSNSSRRKNLENFLLYKAANDFCLYSGVNDADFTAPVMKHFKELLLSLDEVKAVRIGQQISNKEKGRALEVVLQDGDIIYLETDTAHSLMTDLGSFIREMIPKVEHLARGLYWPEHTYFKTYGLNGTISKQILRGFRNYYFYTLIDRLFVTLTDENDRKRLEALEKGAGAIHTLENMILVPYGYNCKRGFKLNTHLSKIKINDDFGLTLKDFQEMLDDTHFTTKKLQKRLGNSKCTLRSIEFLMKHQAVLLNAKDMKLFE